MRKSQTVSHFQKKHNCRTQEGACREGNIFWKRNWLKTVVTSSFEVYFQTSFPYIHSYTIINPLSPCLCRPLICFSPATESKGLIRNSLEPQLSPLGLTRSASGYNMFTFSRHFCFFLDVSLCVDVCFNVKEKKTSYDCWALVQQETHTFQKGLQSYFFFKWNETSFLCNTPTQSSKKQQTDPADSVALTTVVCCSRSPLMPPKHSKENRGKERERKREK